MSPACCQVVTSVSKVHRSTSTLLFTHQNPGRQKIHLTFVHIITSPIIPTEPTTCTKTPRPPFILTIQKPQPFKKPSPTQHPIFQKAFPPGTDQRIKRDTKIQKEKVNIRASNNKREKRRMHHADMSVSNMRARFEKKTTSCPSANTTISSTPHAPASFPLGYHTLNIRSWK